jgi:SAM-dependent methyltransferase
MITRLSAGAADEGMPQEILTETLGLVRQHPWWIARARLAIAVLNQNRIEPPSNVFDVGCGWGVTLDGLEAAGYRASGLDISRNILERIDHPSRRLVEADLRQPLPSLAGQADAFLLLDVIEHVDDDREVVRHSAQLLRPGGVAVVSVPARPDLFSEFDQIQGHRRRYLPERLKSAFIDTGLELSQMFWWGAWMVPLLKRRHKGARANDSNAAKTYTDYLRLPPWPVPWLMRLLYRWEQPRALEGKVQTGSSLFAVAKRQI